MKTLTIRVIYLNERGGTFEKNYDVTNKTLDDIEFLLDDSSCVDPEILAIRNPGKVIYIGKPI